MDEEKRFGFYLDITLRKIQNAFLEAFRENEVDLTIEQWVVMNQIYLLGAKASQLEITNMNFRTRATTSKMIATLCSKGLIRKVRFEGDLKRFKLEFTAEGSALVKRVLPIAKALRKQGYQGIEKEDFDVFLKVMQQMRGNYE